MDKIAIRNDRALNRPERGMVRTIPQEDVADMIKVPLADGNHYIALNNYRKAKRMKKEPFFRAWERIGIIYKVRNEDTGQNQWVPTALGREYMVSHPKYPNAYGLHTGELPNLLSKYKNLFVAYYREVEAELNRAKAEKEALLVE